MVDNEFFDSLLRDARGRIGEITYVSSIDGAIKFLGIYRNVVLTRVETIEDRNMVAAVAEHIGALDATRDALAALLGEVTLLGAGRSDHSKGSIN